mmetsp:Transcript_1152/g.4767  ORF Transcript_1152/g.4767 Transcript_1152/m.4767 type:complete len:292 (+) Transcript_1152:98-973(+)
MCWGSSVSFSFAVAELLLLAAVWAFRDSRPYARSFTPLAATVVFAEICEGLIWPHVQTFGSRLENSPECPWLNFLLTQAMLMAVQVQPVAICFLAKRTPLGSQHAQTKELHLLSSIAWAMAGLYWIAQGVTFATDANDRVYHVYGNGSVVTPAGFSYATTCSYRGPHEHLLWQAGLTNRYSDFFPNAFAYFGVWIAAITMVHDKIEATFLMFVVAIFGSLLLAWNGGEAGSVWCWTGILPFIFYAVFPHLKARFKIPDVVSWSSMMPPCCRQGSPSLGTKVPDRAVKEHSK